MITRITVNDKPLQEVLDFAHGGEISDALKCEVKEKALIVKFSRSVKPPTRTYRKPRRGKVILRNDIKEERNRILLLRSMSMHIVNLGSGKILVVKIGKRVFIKTIKN